MGLKFPVGHGWFSHVSVDLRGYPEFIAPEEGVLQKVTQGRLGAWLQSHDIDFEVLDNQDFWLASDQGGIQLHADPAVGVLRMWGHWRGVASSASVREKIQRVLIEEGWEIGGVKVVDDIDAEGNARIRYEYCMPIAEGMTDDQLAEMFVFWSGFAQTIDKCERLFREMVES
ncbi:MAG: hypothetical protein Q4A92_02960 [Corynebacterium sp.]|nr:hypothetical protein [Corynebacterium sp.]